MIRHGRYRARPARRRHRGAVRHLHLADLEVGFKSLRVHGLPIGRFAAGSCAYELAGRPDRQAPPVDRPAERLGEFLPGSSTPSPAASSVREPPPWALTTRTRPIATS